MLSSVVIMWRRMLVKICGVDSWDSECSTSSEPLTRHRNSGQRSVSKGNGAEISTPEQKPGSKQGLRGEKLEDKAGA